MSTRGTATRLLVARVVKDRLTEADRDLRATAREDFDQPGVRDIGVITVAGEAQQLGSVQLTKGRTSWRVTDPAALLAWVKANHPGEVVTVDRVRSSYEGALLMQARKQGAPVTDAGEVVPGIEAIEGDPTLNVKPSEDAAALVAQAFAEGTLSFADVAVPAIEAQS